MDVMSRKGFFPRSALSPLVAFVLCLVPFAAKAQTNEFRGMWVDAWGTGFLNANEVTQLINDCRAYNFNAIVVQMRRRGDAFYNNVLPGNDPKTTAIASNFDALQDIITKARTGSPRIEVHCWVVTYKIWSSENSPPSQPGHIYNLHPEYLTQNQAGGRFTGEGYFLDPGHPGVTTWNYVMATNIVRRYDVDGFHWDYIRYPEPDSGYNPTAIARYNAEFGTTGQPSTSSTQFSNWRRRQVTDFLRWANAELMAIRPNLQISCAVFGNRSDAYNARYQDWAAWNNEGIIDICMPMGYTADNSLFTSRVTDSFNNQGVRRVYNGQGAYLNVISNSVWQLNYIRNKPLLGSVLYSYRVPNSGTVNRSASLAYIRDNHQPSWVNVPAIPWKAAPSKGILRGRVTRSDNGQPIYNASATLQTSPSRTVLTDPHGNFAFFETTPGSWSVSATANGMGAVTNFVSIGAGSNIVVNLVVPATDITPPILSGITAGSITDTSARITWATDETANSMVDYGLTSAYGMTISNTAMALNHSISLTNLQSNSTYHFRCRSRNAAGLEGASGDFTFTTNPQGVVNDVIVECRLAGGILNSNPPYSDVGFSDSTLKSTAPGLSGTGSRYATAGTPSFTIKPTLPVGGGSYDVYLTHGNVVRVSDDIVVSVTQTGGTGLSASTTLLQQPGANTWEYLGRLKLNPGVTVPTLVFTYSSGELNTGGNGRMYSDSIKFVFVPPPAPPSITNQPQGKVIHQGGSATFSVGATGAAPMSYQWRFDGANLSGETGSSFTVNNAQPLHEGEYSVIVSNPGGVAMSESALLNVVVPPLIITHPVSRSVQAGEDVTFSVVTDGTGPFSYQWRRNGTNITGATEDLLTLDGVQTNAAGNYSVVVTNAAGSATSAEAALEVLPLLPPVFEQINRLADGRIRLAVSLAPGGDYVLQVSTNLTFWADVITLMATNGNMEFIDDDSTNGLLRFYRLRR